MGAEGSFHLFFGRDDFHIREAQRALRDPLDGDGMLDTNTTQLAARGLSAQEVMQHAATLPFMGQARLVVVEGLVSSLGGARAVLQQWQPLVDLLPELAPSNHVLLLEPFTGRDWRDQERNFKRSALTRALRAVDGADVREFRELRGSELARWVRERAAASGAQMEPAAQRELVQLVGADLWMLAGEIDKLARYAAGRAVTVDDVRALTPQAREAVIFDVVDAVAEGHAAPALRLIRQMLDQGTETPQHIQFMIARQFGHLVRATELLAAGADQRAVGEATGVTHEFPLGKLVSQARASSSAAVEAGLRAIEESDHAVKTGRMEEVLALELLVNRLAELTRQPAGAR